jgi:hypothetical protein
LGPFWMTRVFIALLSAYGHHQRLTREWTA